MSVEIWWVHMSMWYGGVRRTHSMCSMWNNTAFSEKRSENRSQRSIQKISVFWVEFNLEPRRGFKIIIFQYIICEPLRNWKEGLTKLDVNLWEIWRKFKCRRSMCYPPDLYYLYIILTYKTYRSKRKTRTIKCSHKLKRNIKVNGNGITINATSNKNSSYTNGC